MSTDRFFLNAFTQQVTKDKSRDRNVNNRPRAENMVDPLPKISDAEVFLAVNQLRRQQAASEKQRIRGNNRNRYSDYDTDFLYYL